MAIDATKEERLARMAEEERCSGIMWKLGSMMRYLGQRTTDNELRGMANEVDCDCDGCLDAQLARRMNCTQEEISEALEGFCSCGCWGEQRAEPVQKKRRRRDRRGGTRPREKLRRGMLVMFMHAGLAMLGTGCCRAKHASNKLMKDLVNACVGTLASFSFVKQGAGLAMQATMDYIPMIAHVGCTILETVCCRAKCASNMLIKGLVNAYFHTLAWFSFVTH